MVYALNHFSKRMRIEELEGYLRIEKFIKQEKLIENEIKQQLEKIDEDCGSNLVQMYERTDKSNLDEIAEIEEFGTCNVWEANNGWDGNYERVDTSKGIEERINYHFDEAITGITEATARSIENEAHGRENDYDLEKTIHGTQKLKEARENILTSSEAILSKACKEAVESTEIDNTEWMDYLEGEEGRKLKDGYNKTKEYCSQTLKEKIGEEKANAILSIEAEDLCYFTTEEIIDEEYTDNEVHYQILEWQQINKNATSKIYGSNSPENRGARLFGMVALENGVYVGEDIAKVIAEKAVENGEFEAMHNTCSETIRYDTTGRNELRAEDMKQALLNTEQCKSYFDGLKKGCEIISKLSEDNETLSKICEMASKIEQGWCNTKHDWVYYYPSKIVPDTTENYQNGIKDAAETLCNTRDDLLRKTVEEMLGEYDHGALYTPAYNLFKKTQDQLKDTRLNEELETLSKVESKDRDMLVKTFSLIRKMEKPIEAQSTKKIKIKM